MKSALLSVLSLLATSSASPLPPDCPTLMYSTSLAAIPPSFPGVVAHGVHSLTLPDIHFYFPTNKTDIIMPVLNPDLLSSELILHRPPHFQHRFSGPALRAVDQVLTHMNSPHRDLELYTDLEKLVHTAHMQEIWLQAGKAYAQLQELNNVGEPLCQCIKDVENNGVIKVLRRIALKIRESGLKNGEHKGVTPEEDNSHKKINVNVFDPDSPVYDPQPNHNAQNDWEGNLYKYNSVEKDDKTAEAARKINDEENLNNENTEMNVQKMNNDSKNMTQDLAPGDEDSLKPLPHLTSPQDWEVWKSNMATMERHMDEYSRILALYMHCMLR